MKNIKIIDQYITKQILESFLLGIVIFTSLMFASDAFLTIIKQISNFGISFQIAFMLIVLKIPSILVLTIPMGVLLSTVMTVNKLCLNSEIAVMRACGIGIARLARPILIFSLIAASISFIINEYVVPASNLQAKALITLAIAQKNVPDGKKAFSFKELGSNNQLKRLFYIDSNDNKQLHGITVLDVTKKGTIQIIQSKYGSTAPNYWNFNNGVAYTISEKGDVLNTTVFNQLKLYNDTGNLMKIKDKTAGQLNFLGLAKYLQKKEHKQLPSFTNLVIELNEKLTIPLIAIAFALIGVPLAINPPRAKFNRGFLFSILIIFLYYLLRAFSTALGLNEIINPTLSAWLPLLIIGTTGLVLFYKKSVA